MAASKNCSCTLFSAPLFVPCRCRCGFSRKSVAMLEEAGFTFAHFDILLDEKVSLSLVFLCSRPYQESKKQLSLSFILSSPMSTIYLFDSTVSVLGLVLPRFDKASKYTPTGRRSRSCTSTESSSVVLTLSKSCTRTMNWLI